MVRIELLALCRMGISCSRTVDTVGQIRGEIQG